MLASIVMRNGKLRIETNSAERAEQDMAIIAELLPNAVLLEHLSSTFEDIREDEAYEEYVFGQTEHNRESPLSGTGLMDPSELPPSELAPELKAILRQQMDRHEERWVDESIPALGGATPREALDDPTRRDDLFRLLERMEGMEARIPMDQAGLGMRVSRLRELLGL
ncbi:MAG: hypothetical protein V9F03_00085 [Microthrixaceae bacterium]